jgi:predicted component of type VI protein secretion system
MISGFRLVMSKGPEPGQSFNLDKDVIGIGRDHANDIVVNHPQASRHHARLMRQGNVYVIQDLGSTNRTFVNGMQVVQPQTLNNGDVIGLGDSVTFTFYGPAAGFEDTIVAQPGAAPEYPATAVIPQPSAAPPYAPDYQYQDDYYAGPPDPYGPPVEEEPPVKSRKVLYIGCGCLILLLVFVCVLPVILDFLGWLPVAFYDTAEQIFATIGIEGWLPW